MIQLTNTFCWHVILLNKVRSVKMLIYTKFMPHKMKDCKLLYTYR
jgi:hypothetical protein